MSVLPKYTLPFTKEGTLADVYLPDSGNGPTPTVLYWHGLSCGDRGSYLPVWFISKLLDKGYGLVSADYKLLPPSNGYAILEDVSSVVKWAGSPEGLNKQLKEKNETIAIDPSRLVVAGTSAGGYLAYMAAIHARTDRPLRGVLSMYGMGGSFLIPHYLKPKTRPFFRGRPLLDRERFEEWLSTTHPPPVSSGSPLEYGPDGIPSSPRMFLSRVFLQEGLFLDYLTGEHGLSSRLRGLEQPTMSDVPERHHILFPEACISPSFPPTCLVHGTEDSAVLIEESRALQGRLQRTGVQCQLIQVAGAEHSFDYSPGHEQVLGQVFEVVEGWLGSDS